MRARSLIVWAGEVDSEESRKGIRLICNDAIRLPVRFSQIQRQCRRSHSVLDGERDDLVDVPYRLKLRIVRITFGAGKQGLGRDSKLNVLVSAGVVDAQEFGITAQIGCYGCLGGLYVESDDGSTVRRYDQVPDPARTIQDDSRARGLLRPSAEEPG